MILSRSCGERAFASVVVAIAMLAYVVFERPAPAETPIAAFTASGGRLPRAAPAVSPPALERDAVATPELPISGSL